MEENNFLEVIMFRLYKIINHLYEEERELVALLLLSFGCLVTVNVL